MSTGITLVIFLSVSSIHKIPTIYLSAIIRNSNNINTLRADSWTDEAWHTAFPEVMAGRTVEYMYIEVEATPMWMLPISCCTPAYPLFTVVISLLDVHIAKQA